MNLSYATTFRDVPTLAAGWANGTSEPPQVFVEFLRPPSSTPTSRHRASCWPATITRKPHVGERASGRALLNLLADSHVLGSVPRCVFVLQSASDGVTETRLVWTCCKNNDGALGPRTAWERRNGRFQPSQRRSSVAGLSRPYRP